MPAADPEFSSGPAIWSASIVSHASFFQILEEALYETRRRADAQPAAWIYQSLAGMFEGLRYLTTEGRRPDPGEYQPIVAMLPALAAQADAEAEQLIAVVQRLCAYMLEWPAGAAHAEAPPEPEPDPSIGQPYFEKLDSLIPALHALMRTLDKASKAARKRPQRDPHLARAISDSARAVGKELEQMLSAIGKWARTAIAPADHDARPAEGLQNSRQLARYLPGHVHAIQQARGSFAAWKVASHAARESIEVSSIEDLIALLHPALNEADALLTLAPDHVGMRTLHERLHWIHDRTCRWISDLEEPEERDTDIAQTVAQHFDLVHWPQLSAVQMGLRQLRAMQRWSAGSRQPTAAQHIAGGKR